jgi:hypothetical protein
MIRLQPHLSPRRRIPNTLAVIAALVCVLTAWQGDPNPPATAGLETDPVDSRYSATLERPSRLPAPPPRPLRQALPPFIVPGP